MMLIIQYVFCAKNIIFCNRITRLVLFLIFRYETLNLFGTIITQ